MNPPDDKNAAATADGAGQARFKQAIFRELEAKLRQSPWNAGVSEAHGLLTALACCGVKADAIRSSAWLFRLDNAEDAQILDGLHAMVCRDLDDAEFSFDLMLPDETHSPGERIEAVSDWCQGFLQGIYHKDGELPAGSGSAVKEAVEDISRIGHLEADDEDPEDIERALVEIIEFLRVAAQLIYDELQPAQATNQKPVHLN